MTRGRRTPTLPSAERPSAERLSIERRIDEMVAQSFPASDPPAWGTLAALLEQEDREPEGTQGPADG